MEQRVLNDFWGCVLSEIQFDVLNHKITLKLKDDNIINEIIFKGVAAFFFLNEEGENRFSFGEYGGYLELTEISYLPKGIGKLALVDVKEDKEWAQNQYANANFYILIWNSSLFIEATTIIINNIKYDLKKINTSFSDENMGNTVSSFKKFIEKFNK
ncbi:YxiG family protein [Niallia sp. 03190]|uniref:YxiG family protein n=1 Tax=Niallia sp. 03190 TaxID=3458061 RepID=UPI0040445C72